MCACAVDKNKVWSKDEKDLDCDKDFHRLAVEIKKREYRNSDINSPCNKWHILQYKKHRRRIQQVKSLTDSSTPRFHPSYFTRSNAVYNQRLKEFVRIERDNTMLTKHIEDIFKGRGLIDDELSPRIKRTNHAFRTRFHEELRKARDNAIIADRLIKVRSTMSRKEHLDWYAKQEDKMEIMARYPLYWRSRICRPYEKFAMNNAKSGQKPTVYFDFEIKNIKIGRVIIELNTGAAPVAVENFRALCNGSGKHSFLCCKLDKIWPGVYYKAGNGAGGAVSTTLPPKKNRMKHDTEGIVTLVNNGDGMFDAEFMIIARELKPLDGKNLAIGRVTEGMEFLQSCTEYLSPNTMVPKTPIYIVKTGEIDPDGPQPDPPRQIAHSTPSKYNAETAKGNVEDEAEAEEDDEEEEEDEEEETNIKAKDNLGKTEKDEKDANQDDEDEESK